MKKFLLPLIIGATFAVGIFTGQVVQADTAATPGSPEDPLVSKSYVDQVSTKITSLEEKITALQGTITTLQQKVTTLEAKLQPATPALPKTAVVTGTYLNLRLKPSTTASIIATLTKGTTMKVLSKSSTWYKVQIANGKIGWVSASLVKVTY